MLEALLRDSTLGLDEFYFSADLIDVFHHAARVACMLDALVEQVFFVLWVRSLLKVEEISAFIAINSAFAGKSLINLRITIISLSLNNTF